MLKNSGYLTHSLKIGENHVKATNKMWLIHDKMRIKMGKENKKYIMKYNGLGQKTNKQQLTVNK